MGAADGLHHRGAGGPASTRRRCSRACRCRVRRSCCRATCWALRLGTAAFAVACRPRRPAAVVTARAGGGSGRAFPHDGVRRRRDRRRRAAPGGPCASDSSAWLASSRFCRSSASASSSCPARSATVSRCGSPSAAWSRPSSHCTPAWRTRASRRSRRRRSHASLWVSYRTSVWLVGRRDL
ncbi:MAG: hypothetical protein MZV64_43240 [Ignavibacteriales bacterium]|nr:hypothetical protein [Ignavibacteriales bacterium]